MSDRRKTGRPLGSKNRATVINAQMEREVEIIHPVTGRKMKGSAEDAIALALIERARRGNVKAFSLIFDAVYGRSQSLRKPEFFGLKIT